MYHRGGVRSESIPEVPPPSHSPSPPQTANVCTPFSCDLHPPSETWVPRDHSHLGPPFVPPEDNLHSGGAQPTMGSSQNLNQTNSRPKQLALTLKMFSPCQILYRNLHREEETHATKKQHCPIVAETAMTFRATRTHPVGGAGPKTGKLRPPKRHSVRRPPQQIHEHLCAESRMNHTKIHEKATLAHVPMFGRQFEVNPTSRTKQK